MSAQDIAAQLDVTAMAVRQHLYDLAERKLVNFSERRQKAGRPIKIWALTPAANAFFPDGHAELAVGLIHTVRATFGDQGIEQLVRVRTKTQCKTYGRALDGHNALQDRLSALADIRTAEGYMAEVQQHGDGGFMFIEHHCPVCSAVQACTGLCASELEVFSTVLGDGVDVQRTDHLLAGAQRCAYRVRKTGDETS